MQTLPQGYNKSNAHPTVAAAAMMAMLSRRPRYWVQERILEKKDVQAPLIVDISRERQRLYDSDETTSDDRVSDEASPHGAMYASAQAAAAASLPYMPYTPFDSYAYDNNNIIKLARDGTPQLHGALSNIQLETV